MPSFLQVILALAACIAMTIATTIPQEALPVHDLFDKRATLQTCPGINNTLVRAERFRVFCDRDTSQVDATYVKVINDVPDFDDCMGRCEGVANRDFCKYAVWPGRINEPGVCYLKNRATGDPAIVKRSGWKLGVRR